MDELKNWGIGILVSLFNLMAQLEQRFAKIEAQGERLNASSSSIADRLESINEATLTMQRAAKQLEEIAARLKSAKGTI